MEHARPRLSRCAIYTRKSSEEGLEQDFNSLHAQREACEAFIKSQHGEGWRLVRAHYDDGGFSGGTMERPPSSAYSPISARGSSKRWWRTRSTKGSGRSASSNSGFSFPSERPPYAQNAVEQPSRC